MWEQHHRLCFIGSKECLGYQIIGYPLSHNRAAVSSWGFFFNVLPTNLPRPDVTDLQVLHGIDKEVFSSNSWGIAPEIIARTLHIKAGFPVQVRVALAIKCIKFSISLWHMINWFRFKDQLVLILYEVKCTEVLKTLKCWLDDASLVSSNRPPNTSCVWTAGQRNSVDYN